jgi:hypothetical protein
MRLSKLALGELFASIGERRRRSEQQSCEEGVRIMRRLQELLAVPASPQSGETPTSTQAVKENESSPSL